MSTLKNPPLLKLFGMVIFKSKRDDYYDATPLCLCLPTQSPVTFNNLAQETAPPPPVNHQGFRLFGVNINQKIVPSTAASVPSPARTMVANPENKSKKKRKSTAPPPINHHNQGFRLFGVNQEICPSMAANLVSQSKKKRKSTTPNAAGTGARKKPFIRKRRHTDQENLKVPEVIPSGFTKIIRTKNDFFCRKELTATDVKTSESRLLVIPASQVWIFIQFLNFLEFQNLNTEDGIHVSVVDSGKRFHEMDLAVWPSVGQVVLKKSWASFVTVNELKAGDCLEFWGYRKDGRFCLAVHTVRKQAEAHNNIDLSLSLSIQQQIIIIDSSSDEESVCTKLCL